MWIATPASDVDLEADHGGRPMKTLTWVGLGSITLVITMTGNLSPILAAPAQVQDTSRHLYDRVMEEFKHRDYEAALAGFRLFLELHGQTSLAANAQYWVGECQFRMGRYSEALKAFYHVVSYYPLSPKLAASTLKIGQTYSRLKDHEKARMMYERVVDQYPDSPEAELARKAIEVEAAKAEPAPSITE
jgi:tol-pal system protein YbgF